MTKVSSNPLVALELPHTQILQMYWFAIPQCSDPMLPNQMCMNYWQEIVYGGALEESTTDAEPPWIQLLPTLRYLLTLLLPSPSKPHSTLPMRTSGGTQNKISMNASSPAGEPHCTSVYVLPLKA